MDFGPKIKATGLLVDLTTEYECSGSFKHLIDKHPLQMNNTQNQKKQNKQNNKKQKRDNRKQKDWNQNRLLANSKIQVPRQMVAEPM